MIYATRTSPNVLVVVEVAMLRVIGQERGSDGAWKWELGVAKKVDTARAAASPVLERDQSNTRWAAHGGRR